MIKKVMLAVAMILPLICSAQSVKIGLVDANAIIGAMPETTAAQTTLQEKQQKYEAEYNKLGEELQRQITEIQNMKEDELPAIRERKMKEATDNQQRLQAFEQQIAKDLQKTQEELLAPIIQKVHTAIEAVGREGGYSLIQDLNPQITLYHASPIEDITPLVKAKLGLK